jgi:hypothetical protein
MVLGWRTRDRVIGRKFERGMQVGLDFIGVCWARLEEGFSFCGWDRNKMGKGRVYSLRKQRGEVQRSIEDKSTSTCHENPYSQINDRVSLKISKSMAEHTE